MKKLLVLTLVLGIASLASAGLSISYEDGKIVCSSDVELLGGLDNMVGTIGFSPIGDFALRTEDVPNSEATIISYSDYASYYGYDDLKAIVWSNVGDMILVPSPAGFWFSFDLPGYVLGTESDHDIQVDLTKGDVTPMQSLYLSEVPEPATMALLGLGSLFLARRKK